MKKRPSFWLTLVVALVLVVGGLGPALASVRHTPDESSSTNSLTKCRESRCRFLTGVRVDGTSNTAYTVNFNEAGPEQMATLASCSRLQADVFRLARHLGGQRYTGTLVWGYSVDVLTGRCPQNTYMARSPSPPT